MSIIAPDGDIAQLVERTDRTREARGSNPLISKILLVFMPVHSFVTNSLDDVIIFHSFNKNGLLAQVVRAHP